MSELMIASYVRTRVALSAMYGRIKQNERGADVLEWVGMLIVGALLVAAVVGAVGDANVRDTVTTKINEILGNS